MEGSENKMGLSMQEKKVFTQEISKRYQKAGKQEKTSILNELVKTTGYSHKYILHILANWGKTVIVRLDGKIIKFKTSPRKRWKRGKKQKYTDGFATFLRKICYFSRSGARRYWLH
jgi:ribosome modulation factor